MAAIESSNRRRVSPSKLAPKLLCRAYEPSEFPQGSEGERLRWKHSDEIVRVIKQLIETSYEILGVEVTANRGRVDLLVRSPEGRQIAVEVKSHRGNIREVDKIQAALYWTPQFNEIAVANRRTVLFLTADFVQEVRAAGDIAQEALNSQPEMTAVSFTPHQDVCRTCSNDRCPYLRMGDHNTIIDRLNVNGSKVP
jgi:hypothetical protein